MKVVKTTSGFWACPHCDGVNRLVVPKNHDLPDELTCVDCHTNSGPLEWETEEKESPVLISLEEHNSALSGCRAAATLLAYMVKTPDYINTTVFVQMREHAQQAIEEALAITIE